MITLTPLLAADSFETYTSQSDLSHALNELTTREFVLVVTRKWDDQGEGVALRVTSISS